MKEDVQTTSRLYMAQVAQLYLWQLEEYVWLTKSINYYQSHFFVVLLLLQAVERKKNSTFHLNNFYIFIAHISPGLIYS